MSDTTSGPSGHSDTTGPDTPKHVPVCYVIDEEPSIRHFLSLILHGSGIDSEEFGTDEPFLAALRRRHPALVFLNVSLDSADAVKSIVALKHQKFEGPVQLMSNRGGAVLEHVRGIGEQHGLRMLPPLKKPFDTQTIATIVKELSLGDASPVAARIGLDEALSNGWIEFWYQPRIALRQRQLAGLEAFARARHPTYGVLSPEAFLPGARDADLVNLASLAVKRALRLSASLVQMAISARMTVNVTLEVLQKLPIPELMREHNATGKRGSLTFDITEDEMMADIQHAKAVARDMKQHQIDIAIDDFGRSLSYLAGMKDLPFAELKLAANYVADCGTDKVNAPLCKTMIDLAHDSGGKAGAIGVEKAADALALVSMGCDIGQGHLLGRPMPEERLISLLRQRAENQTRQARTANAES
ncbi:MAG TPA: EAL domain-containing response regulator [Xanthobacteraceae bacterium]|nr:EAL domain-containing response regulator [Xanthobacteraceae bacterium]